MLCLRRQHSVAESIRLSNVIKCMKNVHVRPCTEQMSPSIVFPLLAFLFSRVVRAFLIEEQKIVKQVLLEKQKKKKV